MSIRDQMRDVKRQMMKQNSVLLKLPNKFAFKEHDAYDFEDLISFFDWSFSNRQVKIDLTECKAPNYQALSLLVLYAWKLKNQGCTVSFIESDEELGASSMWRRMGARGTFPVLFSDSMNFKGNEFKPLFAVRNTDDFKKVIETAEAYVDGFNVEYLSTLRYVLSELLYNTLEHGCNFGGDKIHNIRIPSIAQFTWYKNSNEIHFIIADTGIGIKKHIEQAYPGQESDEDAIKLAIRPQVSGTFGSTDPYKQKNNAGIGLFISTNIIRRLKADMFILSGNGLVHASPRDIAITRTPTLRMSESNPIDIARDKISVFTDAV
ncbi:MAG: ATP-binding protein, partial [Candidatus Thiodiazotropha taylori]